MRILTAALLLLALALPALAVEPDEMLDDPALEARAREISRDLRCLVCQNQSIDDSNAELARDLRLLVRERLAEGDTNEEVLDYVVSRYGDYVLLDPPVKDTTYVLWFGPVVIVVFGALAVGLVFRRNRRTARGNGSTAGKPGPMPGLSEAERRRVQKLLDDEDA